MARDIESITRELLEAIGENPYRDGLQDTPARVARMWKEVTSGYEQTAESLIKTAVFDIEYNEMVLVTDISFHSLCEHHLLPFYGVAHVAYLPRKKIVGLSKIPRIVNMFARRLQVQERMTKQIADTLRDALDPLGVAVVLQGKHMCMAMRGVQKANAVMTTSALSGVFQEDERTRAEFMSLVGHTKL